VALGAALALGSCPLTSLDLRENKIGDEGAAAIGEALRCNLRLRALRLAHNSIGDSGALALASGLGHAARASPLQGLDLSHGSIGDAGATALARALSTGVCLRELYLSFNLIGSAGMSEIAAMLEALAAVTGSLPTLRELRLQGNVSVCSAAWLEVRRAKWPELRVLGKTGGLLSGATPEPRPPPAPTGQPSSSSDARAGTSPVGLTTPAGSPGGAGVTSECKLPPGWTDESYTNASGRRIGRYRSPTGRCIASRVSAWQASNDQTSGLRVRMKLKGAVTAALAGLVTAVLAQGYGIEGASHCDRIRAGKARHHKPSRTAQHRRSSMEGTSTASSSGAAAVVTACHGRDARQCLLREDARCASCGALWPRGSITYNSLATFRSKCKLHQKPCVESRLHRSLLGGA
jgi:hypothetical protein